MSATDGRTRTPRADDAAETGTPAEADRPAGGEIERNVEAGAGNGAEPDGDVFHDGNPRRRSVLSIEDLTHSLMGEDIVYEFDLRLEAGEIACLYGPSGCGKTTILRIVAGLIDHDRGEIKSDFKRVSYLFQEHRLLEWRTLWENVMLVTSDPENPETQDRAARILGALHLARSDWHKYPDELSGGMRQRAALARALVIKPDLMLLDEPFSALDHELKLELYGLIRKRVDAGMGAIMVSHDRFETLRLADKIYLLNQKPAHCREIVHLKEPCEKRDEIYIDHYLKQDFWRAYFE